ncbi:MAG: hypothetical protein ACTSQ4_02230 [Candidatus Heimdallarchaeaceae archaeon]
MPLEGLGWLHIASFLGIISSLFILAKVKLRKYNYKEETINNDIVKRSG